MKKIFLLIVTAGVVFPLFAQVKWLNVDSDFGPLPPAVHVYKTTDSLDGKPNIAYYIEADLKNKNLIFTTDTTYRRRMTPAQFYRKNSNPLVVVNTTFFSFATNQNLNLVIKDGKIVSYNVHTLPGRGKDTLTYRHPFGSAIGISSRREADIAWLYTDSSRKYAYALQTPVAPLKDSVARHEFSFFDRRTSVVTRPHEGKLSSSFRKWDMKTAVGGGPVLVQQGQVRISNNEELKFAGKAINDRHPRTAMGYTKDQKLIILVVEGRNPGRAEGATLVQLAQLFRDIGCWEALNLDGGGSSCMLVNGKETIKVSDPVGQRPVPAVFLIKQIHD